MERLKKIIQKDAFYIVLFICICVVAISGVWVSKNNLDIAQKFSGNSENNDNYEEIVDIEPNIVEKKVEEKSEEPKKQDIAKNMDNTNSTEPKIEASKEESKEVAKASAEEVPKETPKVVKNEQLEKVEKTQEPKQVAKEAFSSSGKEQAITMKTPVVGKISKRFAKDDLVFSETLQQWTTHSGVDIQAKEGTPILVPVDGVIKEIKKDNGLGIVITVDHGNGLETKYGNLATDEMVKKGQKVKAGDAISKVGKGSGFSVSEDPHLHFEILKNGKNLNPTDYIQGLK